MIIPKVLRVRVLQFFAFLLAFWFTFGFLGDFALLPPDEGRNAEIAREVKIQNAWLIPTYNDAVYLDKPILYFKIVAFFLQAFGETELAARLPSALFAFFLILATFFFCQNAYDRLSASLTLVIASSTPLYIAFSRSVIFDMPLTFFVSISIFFSYLAEEFQETKRKNFYAISSLSAGIATLLKGPVGFLIPFLVMTTFSLVEKRPRTILHFFSLQNVLPFLIVVLPWFIGVAIAHPDFIYYGIVKESLIRYMPPEFNRTEPFYFFVFIVVTCFFPWSIILFEWIVSISQKRFSLKRIDRLWMCWIISIIVFFSFSHSKLPGYILSLVVPISAIVGHVFALAFRDRCDKYRRHLRWAIFAFALSSFLLFLFALFSSLDMIKINIKPDIAKSLQPFFYQLALLFLISCVCAFFAFMIRSIKVGFCSFVLFSTLLVLVSFHFIITHTDEVSAHKLLDKLPDQYNEKTSVVCLNCFPNGLSFYLKKTFFIFTQNGEELTSNYISHSIESGKSLTKSLILPDQQSMWFENQMEAIFVIAENTNKKELEKIAQKYDVPIRPFGSKYLMLFLPEKMTEQGH